MCNLGDKGEVAHGNVVEDVETVGDSGFWRVLRLSEVMFHNVGKLARVGDCRGVQCKLLSMINASHAQNAA